MYYKATGYNIRTKESAVFCDVNYGCWGYLLRNVSKSNIVIDKIKWKVDRVPNNIFQALGFKYEAEDVVEAFQMVIGNRFQVEAEREDGDIYATFSGFADMPRNHVMWYLFTLRNMIACQGRDTVKALKSRGIRSKRKMLIATLLVTYAETSFGNASMVIRQDSGASFTRYMTTWSDVRNFYKNKDLQGFKDKPFSSGNGYESGRAGIYVQASAHKGLNVHSNGPFTSRYCWGYEVFNSHQSAFSGKEQVGVVLDELAEKLKELK